MICIFVYSLLSFVYDMLYISFNIQYSDTIMLYILYMYCIKYYVCITYIRIYIDIYLYIHAVCVLCIYLICAAKTGFTYLFFCETPIDQAD